MPRRKFAGLLPGVGLFIAATPAFAYVDPGTGAMLVQAILALFVAIVFYFRNPGQLWRDLRSWLKRNRKS